MERAILRSHPVFHATNFEHTESKANLRLDLRRSWRANEDAQIMVREIHGWVASRMFRDASLHLFRFRKGTAP